MTEKLSPLSKRPTFTLSGTFGDIVLHPIQISEVGRPAASIEETEIKDKEGNSIFIPGKATWNKFNFKIEKPTDECMDVLRIIFCLLVKQEPVKPQSVSLRTSYGTELVMRDMPLSTGIVGELKVEIFYPAVEKTETWILKDAWFQTLEFSDGYTAEDVSIKLSVVYNDVVWKD